MGLELWERRCNGYMVEGYLEVLIRLPSIYKSNIRACVAGVIVVARPVANRNTLVRTYHFALKRQVVRLVIIFRRYFFI